MNIIDYQKPIQISQIKDPPEDWEQEIKEFWWLVWHLPNSKQLAWKLYKKKQTFDYYLNRNKYFPLSRL